MHRSGVLENGGIVLKVGFAALGIALVGALLAPVSASAVDTSNVNQWEFSGNFTGPVRSVGLATVTVAGTAEVSSALFATAAADPQSGNCDVADVQAIPRIRNVGTSAMVNLTTGGLSIPPITDSSATAFSGSASVDPGSYELVLSFRCTNSGTLFGFFPSSPVTTLSIASVTNTTHHTIACLATQPPTACTSDKRQVTAVPTGTDVTFAGVIRRTWSDGITTDDPVSGAQTLKSTFIGGTSWSSTVASNCGHTESITVSRQYRCEAGGINYSTVAVASLSHTSDYILSQPVLTPAFAVRGSTVVVSGSVSMRYSDSSLWPAPAGTTVSVQFRAATSSSWTTVLSNQAVNAAGSYSLSFTMTAPGKVRVTSNSRNSPEVDLGELVPSDSYQIADLTLPQEVPARQSLTISAAVKSLWSDNTYRDAPNGTATVIEFAPSFSSTQSEGLNWRTVRTSTVQSGITTATVVPQATGFWRVKVGSDTNRPRFVQVTGSAPVNLSASVLPATGQKPFVDSVSTYQVSASLTGYVGTETVSLFIDLGAGFTLAGDFDADNILTAQPRIRAGRVAGLVTPQLEVRDTDGNVVATGSTTAIFIDSIANYRISTVVPDRAVREGMPGRVTATLSGDTQMGDRVTVSWSGDVRIQRQSGRGWSTVATERNTRGERATFNVPNVGPGNYRLFWVRESVASPPFKFNVVTRTGTVRFTGARASRATVESGLSTTLSVSVQAQYSDRRFYAAPNDVRVSLQSLEGSSWRTVSTRNVRNGNVRIDVKPSASRSYRFLFGSNVISSTIRVTVVPARPASLVVNWPRTYKVREGARFAMHVRTTSGNVWAGTTSIQLQYRFSTSSAWRTLNSYTYRGARMNIEWGPGTYTQIQFRVIAPSLGFTSQQSYRVRGRT